MHSNGSSPGSGHYRRRGYSSWNRLRFQASTNQYTSSGFPSPQSRWTMTTEQGNSCGDHNNNNNAFSNVQYFGRNLTDMKAGYVGRSFDNVMYLGGDFGDQNRRYSAAGSKACGNNFEYSSRQGTNGKFWSEQISSNRDYHNWRPFHDGDGPGGALSTRNGSQHSFESSSTTVDKMTMMDNGNVGMDGVTFMSLQEHEHDYFPPKHESVRRKEGGKWKLLMALLNSDKMKENERKAGCEHFELAGLACSLKTAETDPGLVTLQIGFDLAPLLGYDLCSTRMSSELVAVASLKMNRRSGPRKMIQDQFGLSALIGVLRKAEEEPDLVTLSLGIDLTNLLSLSMKGTENMHSIFGGPWAESPIRAENLPWDVPACYRFSESNCPVQSASIRRAVDSRYSNRFVFVNNLSGELKGHLENPLKAAFQSNQELSNQIRSLQEHLRVLEERKMHEEQNLHTSYASQMQERESHLVGELKKTQELIAEGEKERITLGQQNANLQNTLRTSQETTKAFEDTKKNLDDIVKSEKNTKNLLEDSRNQVVALQEQLQSNISQVQRLEVEQRTLTDQINLWRYKIPSSYS